MPLGHCSTTFFSLDLLDLSLCRRLITQEIQGVTQELQIRNRHVAPHQFRRVGKKFVKQQGRTNKGSCLDDGNIRQAEGKRWEIQGRRVLANSCGGGGERQEGSACGFRAASEGS